MEMSHKSEEPDNRIGSSLLEAIEDAGISRVLHSVNLDTAVGKLSLFRSEPPGSERCVRETEVTDDCDNKGNDTLEDEKPLPACKSSGA